MALTHISNIGGLWTGQDMHGLGYNPSNSQSSDIDATGEKAAYVGRFWHPNGPGTYSVVRAGFCFGNVAVKAGGSALTVSLQDVNLAAGPPIQPDEVQDQTVAIANGDATFAVNTWHRTDAFSAARNVTTGELLALVVEYDGAGRLGADAFRLAGQTFVGRLSGQCTMLSKIGAPAWAANNGLPKVVFEIDDGSFATFYSCLPFTSAVVTAFGQTSTPDEIGIQWTQPIECKVDAARIAAGLASQDIQINLYDAGDTALATVDVDANAYLANGNVFPIVAVFTSEIALEAGQVYRLTAKALSGTTTGCLLAELTLPDVNFVPLHGWPLGACRTSRSDGGAWTDTATTTIPLAGLRVSSIHDGAGGTNRILVPGGFTGGMQSA